MNAIVALGLTLAMCSCSGHSSEPSVGHTDTEKKEDIGLARPSMTINGTAIDAKLGAALETPDCIYFIEGLDRWPLPLLGRRLVVTGHCETIAGQQSPNSGAENPNASMEGPIHMLKNANWRLAE